MDTTTENLISSRGNDYGDAHILTGLVIEVLEEDFTKLVIAHPELVFDWVMMLNKLIRMLHNPMKVDTYDDIMGYALLAKRTVEGEIDGTQLIQTPFESGSSSERKPISE